MAHHPHREASFKDDDDGDEAIRKRALQSGLELGEIAAWHCFPSSSSAVSASSPPPPPPNDNQVPKALPPDVCSYRAAAACVLRNSNNRCVVVLTGGWKTGLFAPVSNSVWIWSKRSAIDNAKNTLTGSDWVPGPPMLEKRVGHALVQCADKLYAIGGYRANSMPVNTIECLNVLHLDPDATTNSCTLSVKWTQLPQRLFCPRAECAAVAVADRYIVVMGGHDGSRVLQTVDVLDTLTSTLVLPQLCMNQPRCNLRAALLHRNSAITIFAVGGEDGFKDLNTIECWKIGIMEEDSCNKGGELVPTSGDERAGTSNRVTQPRSSSLQLNLSEKWRVMDIHLSTARAGFGLVNVGRCLICAGGSSTKSVDVIDTDTANVWRLPPMSKERNGCAAVMLLDNENLNSESSGHLLVMGGDDHSNSLEALQLQDLESTLMSKFPTRTLLDLEIQRHLQQIQEAKQSTDIEVVIKGAKSEELLSHLQPLCKFDQYRSYNELARDIQLQQNRLRRCQKLAERVPILKAIQILEKRLEEKQTTEAESDKAHGWKLERLSNCSAPTSSIGFSELDLEIKQVFVSHTGQDKPAADFAGFLAKALDWMKCTTYPPFWIAIA